MNKYAHLMTKNMSSKELFDTGFRRKPIGYDLIKVYSPHAFVGSAGRNDFGDMDSKGKNKDRRILDRFYKRFPVLKLMPQTFYAKMDFG